MPGPEFQGPQIGGPEGGAPEFSAPEHGVPEFSAPEYGVPQFGAPAYGAAHGAGRPDGNGQAPSAHGFPAAGQGVPPPGAPPYGGGGQQWGPQQPPTGFGDPYGADQDEVDLSRLPPPAPPQQPGPPMPATTGPAHSFARPAAPTPQRPATVTTAGVLTITGSALWMCSLGFAWLVLLALREDLAGSGDIGTALYHRITTIHHTLSQGVWLPAFGLPLAATVVALVMFARVNWSRYALTGIGLAAVAASWTVLGTGGVGIPLICYVVLATALIWTPGARRWFGGARSGRSAAADFDTTPPGHRMEP